MISTKGKLPWTKQGLALLDKINRVIQDNGGRSAMHDIVMFELDGTTHEFDKFLEERVFLKIIEKKIKVKDAADVLNMNRSVFTRKWDAYRKRKLKM